MVKRSFTHRCWVAAAACLLAAALAGCDVLQTVAPVLADAIATAAADTQPQPTAPAAATSGALSDSWYSLYVTNPEVTSQLDEPSGGIPEAVIASFDAAQTSIDLAMYEFNWLPLAEALLRAQQRGVRVRLVTDTDSHQATGIVQLRGGGVPIVEDKRSAIMHDKFAILDGATVWTGSMNFTFNDAYRNNNVFIEIQSSQLAQNYAAEFEEMFTQHQFGPKSPENTPNPVITVSGTEIDNYFSPEDGIARPVLQLLNSAKSSIYFMAFSFTRQDFAEALLDRSAHGVTVKGVFEKTQLTASSDTAWSLLTQGGLAANVRKDGNPYNLHTKVFIVDEATVVLGSYNFSRNAEESNDENILIIHNADIAHALFVEWQKVWATAGE